MSIARPPHSLVHCHSCSALGEEERGPELWLWLAFAKNHLSDSEGKINLFSISAH